MSRWQADNSEMRIRADLANRVDSNLSRNEQETGITFYGDADRLQITTYSPSIVRSILRHSFAQIEWVYLIVPEGRNKKVQDLSPIANSEDRRQIEGVRATLPLGALSIKGKPRNNDHHSGITTTPEDLKGLNEVFGE